MSRIAHSGVRRAEPDVLLHKTFEKTEKGPFAGAGEKQFGQRPWMWKKMWESFAKSAQKFHFPLLPTVVRF
jgi:hypothetical protein